MTEDAGQSANSVSKLFGLYKAEWMNGQLFDLYTEPQYFSELSTARPCVLIGGRGTGKTTVLRGLSYFGQYVLNDSNPGYLRGLPYIGLYYRVDTNRVRAFSGPEAPEEDWIRYFAHYINLELCRLIVEFLQWYELQTLTQLRPTSEDLEAVCAALNVPVCANFGELAQQLRMQTIRFETAINNIVDDKPTNLTMQKAPVDELAKTVSRLSDIENKQFFFLIDEYENLLDYQQRVVNTLIKHCTEHYTFKIGVRELGWRSRATVNEHEQLTHPADYARIDIAEELSGNKFHEFASRVCNERLRRADVGNWSNSFEILSIESMFASMSLDEEVNRLGAKPYWEEVIRAVKENGSKQELEFVESQCPSRLVLFAFWAKNRGVPVMDIVRDAIKNAESWQHRYNNYAYAALFSVRHGRGGIRKYYSGWETFLRLASGNIRYLLELVHQSLLQHFAIDGHLGEPVDAKQQTRAAQVVGKKYLTELEGVTKDGARLTKLLLGLGRIFQVLAASPYGHAPEINQFCIGASTYLDDAKSKEVDELLKAAVMHLALVRSAGTKQLTEADTREYDYMVHPIYAPFFVFSHRRKRKIEIKADDVLALVNEPRRGIEGILREFKSVSGTDSEELPEQMSLFEGYYSGVSR